MSLQAVREFLRERAPDLAIIVSEQSTAAVTDAAHALGVVPGQIAKTLSLKLRQRRFLVVARGDARLDNRNVKATFGGRASMLSTDEVLRAAGHPIGGVCPFGPATPLPVYCDVSLRDFTEVFPPRPAPPTPPSGSRLSGSRH